MNFELYIILVGAYAFGYLSAAFRYIRISRQLASQNYNAGWIDGKKFGENNGQ